MSMYEHIVFTDPNISINGVDFYMESMSASEPVERREVKRTSLMNGTEFVNRGKWIGKQFTFTTHISVPKDKPDAYDDILAEICNGIVEVVSLDLGSFKAEVTLQKNHATAHPNMVELQFTVKQVASESGIVGDEVVTPSVEVVKEVDNSDSNK